MGLPDRNETQEKRQRLWSVSFFGCISECFFFFFFLVCGGASLPENVSTTFKGVQLLAVFEPQSVYPNVHDKFVS